MTAGTHTEGIMMHARLRAPLIVALLALLSIPHQLLAPSTAAAASSLEEEFVSLINDARSARGLHRLRVEGELRQVARNHSDTMASRSVLHHNPTLTTDVSNWSRLTENIGRGSSVARIHQALMDSSGHRANILDVNVDEVGVGVAVRDGTVWVTQIFRKPSRSTSSATSSGSFTDVPLNSPHLRDIEWLLDSGITRGCSADRFCPRDPVTREQMASFIVRGVRLPAAGSGHGFVDVSGVHAGDIASLASSGITRGCNPPANDRFCPRSAVTREQMATFLVRALELPTVSGNRFRDVSGMHTADINALAAAGITMGCNPPTNDRFCPRDAVTREEMASFLARALR